MRARFAVTYVFPTPVSVPVIKSPAVAAETAIKAIYRGLIQGASRGEIIRAVIRKSSIDNVTHAVQHVVVNCLRG
jgi:hypothetical protein